MGGALPDTLRFVDAEHKGTRFEGQGVVVFGGSSGIGFAAAASFAQECAAVGIVARNAKQLALARDVVASLDRRHCKHPAARAFAAAADVRDREQVRAALAQLSAELGGVDVVLNTAGMSGFIGRGLGEVPDKVFFSKFDAVYNNLYGAMYVSAEAVRLWKLGENTLEASRVGKTPALISIASEEAYQPCPGCAMYGISKSGIVQLSRSLAAMYEGQLRTYVLAPGLVNTPMTWNQIRGTRIAPDGSLEQVDELQPYQCYDASNHSRIILDGTCPGGGTGFGCPCPDESAEDPRLALKFGGHLWPPIDPIALGLLALDLAGDSDGEQSGFSFVVDNNTTTPRSGAHVVRECPPSMTELCPLADFALGSAPVARAWPISAPAGFDVHLQSLLLGAACGWVINSLWYRRRSRLSGDSKGLLS